MQLRRVSLLVVFTLFVCSLLFAQETTAKVKKIEKTAPNTIQTASDSTKSSPRKVVRKKKRVTRPSYSKKYKKTVRAPRVSHNWQMEKLKNREKFADDWINHLQEELSGYKEERAEARKGMKNLLQQDIQEKLEAKKKLEMEQQAQLKLREAEIDSLKMMQSAIDTTK